jgi:uncharacterized membrane protein YbhN (UPF0104 family)
MSNARGRVTGAYRPPERHRVLALLFGAAIILDLAAAGGLAYVAGFSKVLAALSEFRWNWLLVMLGAMLISWAGYFVAYKGIFRAEGGPSLPARQLFAVVTAGFGGFIGHGGASLEHHALVAAGADERQASARVAGLAGLEYGVLSIGCSGAAIAVLVAGLRLPPSSVTIPWAVCPVPGFAIAFWLAERYRARFAAGTGWRRRVGIFLESVHIVRVLFLQPTRWGPAAIGMALFWAAEAFAAWAGLAATGAHMDTAAFIVGFGTGMIVTRRTSPLAGAGILALALPAAIWYSGAPLALAVIGLFAYRAISLWLPMPVTFAALPTLQKLCATHAAAPAATAPAATGPAITAPAVSGPAGGELAVGSGMAGNAADRQLSLRRRGPAP